MATSSRSVNVDDQGPADLRSSTWTLARLTQRSGSSSSEGRPAPAVTSAPNLGVVELTIALHRVFDSPRDASCSTPATRLRPQDR